MDFITEVIVVIQFYLVGVASGMFIASCMWYFWSKGG